MNNDNVANNAPAAPGAMKIATTNAAATGGTVVGLFVGFYVAGVIIATAKRFKKTPSVTTEES